MIAYSKVLLERLLKRDFVRFCIVGMTGFIINLILLTFFRNTVHLTIFIAQAISAEIALFSNFILHHNWTYKSHSVNKTVRVLIIQFHTTSWMAILGSAAIVSIGVGVFHLSNLVALIVSAVVSLMWNFAWSKFVIWRDIATKEAEVALD